MKIKTNPMLFLMLITLMVLTFPGSYRYFELKLEQLLTVFVCILSILAIIKFKLNIEARTYFLSMSISFFYITLIVISLLRGTNVFISNDFVEVFKPIFFLSFFLLPFTVKWNLLTLAKFYKFIIWICLALVFFGLFESLTSFGNQLSLLLYKPNRGVLEGKAVGPFLITYAFATFLVLPLFWFISRWLSSPKLANVNVVFMILCLFCILLTQSKTVFLSLILTLTIFVVVYPFYSNFPRKRVVVISGLICVIGLLLSLAFLISFFEDYFNYIYSGLEVVFRSLQENGLMKAIESNPSTSHRYDQLIFAWDHQDLIPLIGVGIGKSLFMPESFYALYLYRVGLLGIMMHFIILVVAIVMSYRNAKSLYEMHCNELASFFVGIHFYILSLPLSYCSAAVNDQTRTGFVLYVMLAINIAVNNYLKRLPRVLD